MLGGKLRSVWLWYSSSRGWECGEASLLLFSEHLSLRASGSMANKPPRLCCFRERWMVMVTLCHSTRELEGPEETWDFSTLYSKWVLLSRVSGSIMARLHGACCSLANAPCHFEWQRDPVKWLGPLHTHLYKFKSSRQRMWWKEPYDKARHTPVTSMFRNVVLESMGYNVL